MYTLGVIVLEATVLFLAVTKGEKKKTVASSESICSRSGLKCRIVFTACLKKLNKTKKRKEI